ncbi:LOW QUALITY PROTEIN: killin [Hipposideros larvatus]
MFRGARQWAAPRSIPWRSEHFPPSGFQFGSPRPTPARPSRATSPRPAPPLLGRSENPDGIASGPGSVLPKPGCARWRLGLLARVRDGRKLQPASGRGRGDIGGFKRRWRDTPTVGTTFRRSRVFLVGELSKFPLPYDSCRGEWFAYFVRGAPALCGQGTPEPPGSRRKNGFSESPTGALSGLTPGSWLHKHPHPNTCPRLPHQWLPPLIVADHRARVPKLVPLFACYPQSKLNGRDLTLLAQDRLKLRVPNSGRRCWAPGGLGLLVC